MTRMLAGWLLAFGLCGQGTLFAKPPGPAVKPDGELRVPSPYTLEFYQRERESDARPGSSSDLSATVAEFQRNVLKIVFRLFDRCVQSGE